MYKYLNRFNWSCNMIKQNTKSILQIVETNYDRKITWTRERNNFNDTTKICIWGNPPLKTLLYVYCIKSRIWNNTMLFTFLRNLCNISDCLTLIPTRMVWYLTNFLLSVAQPCLRILGGIEPLLIRKFPRIEYAIHLRNLADLMHDLYNFLIIQHIVLFYLTQSRPGHT